jgi:hypothetical protein
LSIRGNKELDKKDHRKKTLKVTLSKRKLSEKKTLIEFLHLFLWMILLRKTHILKVVMVFHPAEITIQK